MTIDLNTVSTAIIALVSTPAVISIISAVCSYLKSKHTIHSEIKQPLNNTVKAIKEENKLLKDQLIAAHQDNRELKKKLNELLTKIDRIDRSNEEI